MYRKITQEKLLKRYKCFQAPMNIYNDCMFLTASHNMTEYAKKWCAIYIRSDCYQKIKNYIDYQSLGAAFYADGCYIKTPKGIIERL